MKSIIVLYPGGFHGEFFIGNIVTNTDKFYYFQFFCRSEKLNAYAYKAIERNPQDPDYDSIGPILENKYQTDDTVEYYSTWHGKPIITNSHDHITTRTLPVVRLYTKDPMYERRGVLLQCIKSLDKSYSNINGVPKSPPNNFDTPLKEGNHTTDIILHVDIKEWLHNKNLEKIEDFFQVEYTQTMKDAVTQYYERDNVLLDKYCPNWQNQSNEQLVEQMAKIDKEYGFFG
jgi:hypothetical protein